MDTAKQKRLIELLRERSFERKRVILASGKESDFFIDCKQTALTAEGHALIGELMFDMLESLPNCDAVGGVELGGCPLASAVSRPSLRVPGSGSPWPNAMSFRRSLSSKAASPVRLPRGWPGHHCRR